jgi:hypothetical protein
VGAAAATVWLGYRLLQSVWAMFDHAYLNAYYFVPGSQVNNAYWAAVRFALHATVMLVAFLSAFVTFVVLEIMRAIGR